MAARLKDVAALAGVSVRTVSNVVSNAAPVAPATRARVMAAVEELGYRPNLAARNLRQGRTGLIGVVVPEIHSPYFGALAELLIDAARERGWTVLLERTGGRPDLERRLLDGSEGHQVDGMIVSPWSTSPAELASLAGGLPLVVLGELAPDGAIDHVALDNVAAARDAARHLVAGGRRRVAAIGLQSELGHGTAELRAEGFRQGLRESGLSPVAEVEVADLHRGEGARALRELLRLPGRPDAVFCFSDELALGALRVAAEEGVRVPEDLALMGFDDIEDGRFAAPSLTTIAPYREQIAERAVQCLTERVLGRFEALPGRRIVVPHRVLPRESTGGPVPPGAPDGPDTPDGPGRG
ncbi:LacI family DNA-binding transcriptional regulator [Streptomyces sp. ME02-7008A-1]|uniref:LacI family DNA-binding transcriptional regulator n=1 Tax=unclassified Streptomyces TaxID=2593676 RepID=UPI0025B4D5FF|nr:MULTISPECIES: LacI family DNA-binding transcriptional regulator [unclassified Streptomyces]MDX3183448.1 LacI family DNA-binding transcriptional regulator [Streptomyces sp. ME02-7008A-1]MDX3303900.1 LacI family DNA-binding transcriptional regulator [Streptomyces sp. ME02-7008A]WJY29932.1 LacI family DNA-binding transcriptional regulator [Streptomyces sp. P9-2B-1]